MDSPLSRRHLLTGSALAAAAVAAPSGAMATAATVRQGRRRIGLPSGVQSGDVTSRQATLWARADGPGRLVVRLDSAGRRGPELRGPRVDRRTDHTGRLDLSGLQPGRRYDARLWFEDADGRRGEVGELGFTTAADPRSTRGGATSFVWTGDTAGQGWGINPDLGGMTAYAAMHRTRPDLFVHCGDTIYADGPLSESVTEVDGQVWRNLLIPEVTKVAETLAEFRARHRYNLMDDNVRAFYADVPVVAQWDDHETVNNWFPGEVLTDARYGEKQVDVLAARARQAWQEWQPIRTDRVRGRGRDGFAAARIYRKIERGPHLDVFCLDMRTEKSPNTPGLEPTPTQTLGDDQVDWLVREVTRSRATWKVISADLPLGLVVPDAPTGQESISNGDPGAPLGREPELARVLRAFKKAGVRNVVWITADVHYCAAHHYSPERAAFTDFDPFWELVAGPINAGTFGPNALDATFGPQVVFQQAAAYPNQSPRGGTSQFFGHAEIDRDGELTVSLRDGTGAVLWSQDLQPRRR
jgi:alkaline phosphatase D